MCGTGAQVAPVIEIDRRRIGDGEPGPLTMRIQDIYNGIVSGAQRQVRRVAQPGVRAGLAAQPHRLRARRAQQRADPPLAVPR